MNTERSDDEPRILQSCYVNISRSGEHFVPNHTLSYVVCGRNDIYLNGKTHSFGEGEFRFTAKNQLAKFTKYPSNTGAFKSISVVIDQHTLRSISEEYHLHRHKAYTGETLLSLKPVPLLQNFITSLGPYLNGSGELNEMITRLKVKEAAMILLETNPNLNDLLFDFDPPGKIDLKAYMTRHYKFNVGLDRFAYLTGRSLATFKRDFEQAFHTSPNKWLQEQRLKEAYFLLKEQRRKVTDVYLDAGFKDLSHFSFAFKKAYGVTPSKVSVG
ncbi:AraC family transcriptional regulator [Mucilaginibacter limnophilus]|uniref:AraC family transcriptional regulator n=1 Tax=Mucilaginibacter limnophilus TaxID=1932778 RepID=A0A3S2UZQ6_9SPHI|nr:helix-turn-helix domain-containing protein [Mucilaginibacter limnophilus]RVT97332.1 AraC family transcriptional regulator [Mucilaginibacter limnophilus]